MAMAERRDRDPAREIEEAPPVRRIKPRPLATLERQLRARIGVHQRGRTRASVGCDVRFGGGGGSIHRRHSSKAIQRAQWPAANELRTQERGRLLGEGARGVKGSYI